MTKKSIKKEEVEDLISRLSNDNDYNIAKGSETISWKAYREAETLTDLNYVPIIKEILKEGKIKDAEVSSFYVLKSIAKNKKDSSIVDFMVDYLTKKDIHELDNDTLYLLMSSIYRTELLFNAAIDFFIDIVDVEYDIVRNTAIKLLGNTLKYKTKAENELIQVLDNAYDEYGIRFAADSLANVGSSNCIDALKKILEEVESEDAIWSIKNAINVIKKR